MCIGSCITLAKGCVFSCRTKIQEGAGYRGRQVHKGHGGEDTAMRMRPGSLTLAIYERHTIVRMTMARPRLQTLRQDAPPRLPPSLPPFSLLPLPPYPLTLPTAFRRVLVSTVGGAATAFPCLPPCRPQPVETICRISVVHFSIARTSCQIPSYLP